jgi:hypothetical protein
MNIVRPTRTDGGWRASQAPTTSAPAAGAERSNPNPQGPVSRTSRAKIGSSAVAPPRSTAKRSSEIAPSTTLWPKMKANPANTELHVTRLLQRRTPRRLDREHEGACGRQQGRGDGVDHPRAAA